MAIRRRQPFQICQRLNSMTKGWFTLVGTFAISVGLITGGILTGNPEFILSGVGLGIFLYFIRNHLK